MQTISLRPIGIIRSPHLTLEGMPIQPTGAKDVVGTIEVDSSYEEGLADLEGFSHIFLIYHFHRSEGFNLTVKPFMDDTPRGLFSTRAPRRPNPIGMSVVELVSRQGCLLHIRGVDVLDKTPLLDIKPFVPRFDAPEAARIGWLENRDNLSETRRSDARFVDPGGESRE